MNNYQLAPKLVLRTPLLPIETILDNAVSEAYLLGLVEDPLIMEALYLASPVLHEELGKWKRGEITIEKEKNRITLSLLKYVTRMSTRCTPFGLFAGCGVFEWAKETSLELRERGSLQRHTRLDMQYLCALARHIALHKDIKSHLRYYSNSTLYRLGGAYRYFERKYAGAEIRYEISEIQSTPYLEKLLTKVSSSGALVSDLVEVLVSDDVTVDEAEEFIMEVVDSQILVSELEPSITGPEYLEQIVVILSNFEGSKQSDFLTQLLTNLRKVSDDLRAIDHGQVKDKVFQYEEIGRKLSAFKIPIDKKFLFQVDLARPAAPATIDFKLAGQIRKAIGFLNIVSQNRIPQNLAQFKTAFVERYEHMEVPLLQVLDNETGIGYLQGGERSDITPIVDDVHFQIKERNEVMISRTEVQRLLHDRYLDAIKNGLYSIEIKDADLSNQNLVWNDLPTSLTVMGSFITTSDSSVKAYIKSAGGTASTASLLGRFTHLDPEIDVLVKELTAHEQYLASEKILAEIVHLPQSRMGNILIRTQVRNYEIPFLAKSVLDTNFQIELQDLTIQVNPSGYILLRSQRLDSEILPRLSSAHNYSTNSLPVYHFLSDLQFQGIRAGLFFNWDLTGIAYPFKPRLEYANTILARASWTFDSKAMEFLGKSSDDQIADVVMSWRKTWSIPRHIAFVEGDNELVIDLENLLFLKLFRDNIRKKSKITFSETFIASGKSIVKDSKNLNYANEFLLTFLHKLAADKPPSVRETKVIRHQETIQRQFSVGSEWLFFKVYAGRSTIDLILSIHIPELVRRLKERGIIDKWFYIRYSDSGYHLRLRFRVIHTGHTGSAISEFHSTFEPLIRDGLVSRTQMDTYVRELERYGTKTIEYVEDIFCAQSEMMVSILAKSVDIPSFESLRFIFGLKFIDFTLDAFGLDGDGKKAFSEKSLRTFEKELGSNSQTIKELGTKYRAMQKAIISALTDGGALSPEWQILEEVRKQHCSQIQLAINELLRTKAANQIEPNFDDLIWGINHMFVNRLTRSKARKHEFVLYAMLLKYYGSLKIKRQSPSTANQTQSDVEQH